jgi:hypothetical protein
MFDFMAIYYNIENAITFLTSIDQDIEVIYGPMDNEKLTKIKEKDDDTTSILLICNRNQCPIDDFSGYLIEECEPLDDTQYIMK